MERRTGPIEECVAEGQEERLRGWLAEQVWPLGRSVNGEELVETVNGQPLRADPLLAYLSQKVHRLLAPA